MQTINEAFEENLELLGRYCPEYTAAIRLADTSGYAFCTTEKDETNLCREGEGEPVYFHAQKGAREEAAMWFQELPVTDDLEALFIYGLGLGYGALEALDWLDGSGSHFLVVFEDDLAVIKMFLCCTHARGIMAHPRFILVPFKRPDQHEKLYLLGDFNLVATTFCFTPYLFFAFPVYRNGRSRQFRELKKHLELRIKSKEWDFNFFKDTFVFVTSANLYHNLKHLCHAHAVYNLKGAFSGVPAVIAAAGPSIAEHYAALGELQDRAALFGAGTGMNLLNRESIFPHFGLGLDPNFASKYRILTNQAFEIPYFYQLQFNHEAADWLHGEKLWYLSINATAMEKWFLQKLGLDGCAEIYSSISTTQGCLGMAAFLGFSPIVLLGLDLSYTDHQRYPQDVTRNPLYEEPEHFKDSQSEEARQVTALNNQGEEVRTRTDWMREATQVGKFAQRHPETEVINSTARGLKIPHIAHVTFEEASRMHLQNSCDLSNWLHTEIQNAERIGASPVKIREILDDWKECLRKSSAIVARLIYEIELIKKAGEAHALENGAVKELEADLQSQEAYAVLTRYVEHVFAETVAKETHVLRFHPKSLEPGERFRKACAMRYSKYVFIKAHLDEQMALVEAALQDQPVPAVQERPGNLTRFDLKELGEYFFDGETFRINDPELGLAIDERFSPQGSCGAGFAQNPKQKAGIQRIPEGECRLEYPSGKLKGVWYYKTGKLHGPARFFSDEGILLAQGWFYAGRRIGKNVQFYRDGSVYSVQRFLEGEKTGVQEYFYASGCRKSILSFSRGSLDGEATLFYPDGNIKRQCGFAQGKLDGFDRIYDRNGQKLAEVEYRGDVPVGTCRIWHPDGRLKKEVIYRGAPTQYDLRVWDLTGRLVKEDLYMPKRIDKDTQKSLGGLGEKISNLKDKFRELKRRKGHE